MNEVASERRLSLRRDVDVVQARQVALRLARALGFPPADQARVDLIVAELATNVLRHAGSGGIVISMPEDANGALAIVCSDAGPGIAAGGREGHLGHGPTLGLGLAVVHELADDVVIKSTEQGTWIRATVIQGSR